MIKHSLNENEKTCSNQTRTPGLYASVNQFVGGPHANKSKLRTPELRLDKKHPFMGIGPMKSIAGFKQNKAPPSC